MKRFMKGCGMAALALAVAGVSLGMTGRIAAGQETINQTVRNVTKGWFHMGGYWDNWGSVTRAVEEAELVDRGTAWETTENIPLVEEIGTWAWTDRYCPGTGIRNLDIELCSGSLMTSVSDDGNIYLEAVGIRGIQGYVEDDTLYIYSPDVGFSDGCVYLYMPEEYSFDEVEIEINAGEIFFDGLRAHEISLEAGAGSITMENVKAEDTLSVCVGAGSIGLYEMEAGELDVEVGMGEFSATGAVEGDLNVECSMGNVDIGLAGREEDYDYHLKGSLGSIQVGYYSGTGLSQERKVDNGAGKTVDVDCSMGSIMIYFLD